jgi:hypothetical protein
MVGDMSDLAVSTILVRDEDQLRDMTYERLRTVTAILGDRLSSTEVLLRGPRKSDVEFIRELIAEIHSCEELLGQVGWRKKRGH